MHILVLESNEDYRSFLWTVLRGANYAVEAPTSGTEALRVLNDADCSPGLIIGNLFAGAAGPGPVIETLAAARWRDIPVILYSTDADTRRFKGVIEPVACVVKGGPLPINEILDRVRAAIKT